MANPSSGASGPLRVARPRTSLRHTLDLFSMPLLALFTAFVLGAIIIGLSSRSLETVAQAYWGLLRGAFIKERGLSETLVATVPYILLSLGVAVGFKSGLFNIGVEGQFYIGAICAAWAGQAFNSLPAIIHLPLALLAGAIGGAVWAAIPGYLKARTGAHEVINTIMLNYVAFRLTEYVVSGPLRDRLASATQTPRVAPGAELWAFSAIPERLQDPLNALGVALVVGVLVLFLLRWMLGLPALGRRLPGAPARRAVPVGGGVLAALLVWVALPPLTRAWWPFTDPYDRLHIGLVLALVAALGVWWFMFRTAVGFELRMVGANPSAAHYAGANITRDIVLAMAISGALAGVAGTLEVLGVSICRCLPLFFSSGYGFESIAIALLGKNNPFGIVVSAFLFGAMRNGADLMELSSGVSKYVISIIQAFALLFVAAPSVVRWMYRIRGLRRAEEEAPLTRGWGG